MNHILMIFNLMIFLSFHNDSNLSQENISAKSQKQLSSKLIFILINESVINCPICTKPFLNSLNAISNENPDALIMGLYLPMMGDILSAENISIARQQLYGFVKANDIKIPFAFYPSHTLSDKLTDGVVVVHYSLQQQRIEPLSRYQRRNRPIP